MMSKVLRSQDHTTRRTIAATNRSALFGAETGGSQGLIVGISHFLPGGGAGPDASPPEKIYYVLAGELTVIVDGKETVAQAARSASTSAPTRAARSSTAATKSASIAVAIAAPVK